MKKLTPSEKTVLREKIARLLCKEYGDNPDAHEPGNLPHLADDIIRLVAQLGKERS